MAATTDAPSELETVGIFSWDSAGKLTDANDSFLQMVGYSRQELADGKIRWRDITPPNQVAREVPQARGQSASFRGECVRKDGHRVPVLVAPRWLKGATIGESLSFSTGPRKSGPRMRFGRARNAIAVSSTAIPSPCGFTTKKPLHSWP